MGCLADVKLSSINYKQLRLSFIEMDNVVAVMLKFERNECLTDEVILSSFFMMVVEIFLTLLKIFIVDLVYLALGWFFFHINSKGEVAFSLSVELEVLLDEILPLLDKFHHLI